MLRLGSLFSGSGGFELAGSLCGIEPVFASEVEPYTIAVTRSRFPNMKHLGSVTDVHGGDIEPVDIITFGSPCQDLSVAGKRAGLKHEANGDDETTRSGLFMEAVRIIKEMREATNGEYPTFALWENVPGAFSSNRGEDFRTVLEELIKIVEPAAVMPQVPKNGWPYADSYCGDGWSLAYRVFDAQYWGVPQRRRRIHLVLDLRGERAREVLFERDGLQGYFATFKTAGQGTAGDATNRTGADDCGGECVGVLASSAENEECAATLAAQCSGTEPTVCVKKAYSIENHPADSRVDIDDSGKVQTLTSRMGTGGGNVTMVMEQKPVYCLQGSMIGREDKNGPQGDGVNGNNQPVVCMATGQANAEILEDKSPCLNCNHEQPIVAGVDCRNSTEYPEKTGTLQEDCFRNINSNGVIRVQYIVRRLTPTECARLQGFPDDWGRPDHKEDFTDEEYRFWLNVRNTHAAINGKAVKDYTEEQMLTWYNKLHTDSAEYKMWGNGIALPPAIYCLQGIVDALGREEIMNIEEIVARLRQTESRSKRKLLDEAADAIEELAKASIVKRIPCEVDPRKEYVELDGIRLVREEGHIVGWYRPAVDYNYHRDHLIAWLQQPSEGE